MTRVSDYEPLRLPMSKFMSRHFLLPRAPSSINTMPFLVSKLSIVDYLVYHHPFKYQDNHFSPLLINHIIIQAPRSRQVDGSFLKINDCLAARRLPTSTDTAAVNPAMTLVGDIVAAATAASATDSALSQSALHLNTAKKQIQDLCKSHGSKLKSLMSTELTLRHQGKQALNRGKLDGTMKVPETKNNVGCLGLEIESIGNVYKVLDFIRNIKLLYLYAGCKRLKIDLLNVNEVLPDAIQARRLRRLIFQAKRLYEVVEAFGFGALLLPVFSDKKILCGLTDKDFISLMDLAKELDLVKFLKAAHAWSPFATLEFELGQITREYKLSFDSLQCYFGSMYNKR